MVDQVQSMGDIFQGHVHTSWALELVPKWAAALSAVRLLLALRRAGVDPVPAWRQVERAAAVLLAHERAGMIFGVGGCRVLDARRHPLLRALLRLAQARESGDEAAPSMLQVLLAGERFLWRELPKGRAVCRVLAACAKAVEGSMSLDFEIGIHDVNPSGQQPAASGTSSTSGGSAPGAWPPHLPLPVEVGGIQEEVYERLSEAIGHCEGATSSGQQAPQEADEPEVAKRRQAARQPAQKPQGGRGSAAASEEEAAAAGGEAAAAGGEAAAAGGALGALGPVGLAVGAALLAVDVGAMAIAGTLHVLGDSVEFAGDELKAFADNDYAGMFDRGIDAAAGALEKIPIAGQVFAAGLELAGTTVRAFTGVVDAFVQRGKELSAYSGDLAGANAMADVRSMLADIQEAQTLGEDLARLTDAQSQFSAELREMLLPIKEWLVGVLADAMEKILEWVDDAKKGYELFQEFSKDVIQLLRDIATFSPNEAVKHMTEGITRLEKIWNRPRAERDDEPDFKTLSEAITNSFKDVNKPRFDLPMLPAPGGMQVPMVPF